MAEREKNMYDHDSALTILEEFRRGKIDESKWYSTIHRFGRANLIEARPDIERFLTSEKPDLRSIALHVLTLYFKLQEHWQTAVDFLLYDPDVSCRSKGASALEWLKRNTRDARTLSILASVVTDKNDEIGVRESAYTAMRGIFHYDNEELLHITDPDFNLESDADWEFVRAHLDPHLEEEWREEAQRVLERYVAGKVVKQEYYAMLLKFGRSHLLEASPEVETFLTSTQTLLRATALSVLVLYFQVPNNWQMAVDALQHDSDSCYRQAAAYSLGILMQNTRDKTTLRILDHIASHDIDQGVGFAAYEALIKIFPGSQEERMAFLDTPDKATH